MITRIMFGNTQYHRFTIKLENGKVTALLLPAGSRGHTAGQRPTLISRDANSSIECTATVSGARFRASAWKTSAKDPKDVQESTITALACLRRAAVRLNVTNSTDNFLPGILRSPQPVLHIWPGDTVHTTTVDAGGVDERGVERSLGGNPQTGPFYIETAWP